jgi:hypothetical protein
MLLAPLLLQVLVPTFRMKDPEEQKKARQELAAGALKEKLTLLNKLVVSCCVMLLCCYTHVTLLFCDDVTG